jgi:outer membrane protein assembly factor BamB
MVDRVVSRSLSVLGWTLLLAAGTSVARADNWPQWRGPTHNGLSAEKNLPTVWSSTEGIAWSLKLPGAAGATPVVWGERIFLTSAEGNDLVLMCVGTDGKERWKKTLGSGDKAARGDEGNLASPSPCTDGKHVWAFVGTGDLACFDVEGKEVWKYNVQEKYGKFQIQFGMSSTPVLHEGRLYLQLIHGEGDPKTREAVVVALDAATGKEVWKVDRPSDARAENEHSYASPTLYLDGDKTFLITHGADYVIAHNLKDGAELWRSGDLHPPSRYDPTLRLVASPVANEGLIVVPSAKQGKLLGLKPGGAGDITGNAALRVFTYSRTPDVPSPLIHEGLVYLCREDGVFVCLDAKTGEKLYENRTQPDRHRASPVLADGHIYSTARNGTVTVIKTGREFQVVSSNSIGETLSASPAISNGRIYLRSFEKLWAVGK